MEDAEKDTEKETGTGVSELNVKDTRPDSGDHVSCQEGPKTTNKDAVMALRMLYEDFEARIQHQDEVSDESTSEAEESPQETVVQSANILPHDEEDDKLFRMMRKMISCS